MFAKKHIVTLFAVCGLITSFAVCGLTASGCGRGAGVSGGERCGNGEVDDGELCDGLNLNGRSCADLNLGTGDLACGSDCTFDVSGCSIQPDCGNDTAEGSEECDGPDLEGETCQTRGFSGGQLGCTTACTFDTSNCTGGTDCGNGQVEGSEQCDGADLNGQTCESLGLVDGTLACNSDCTFDVADCSGQPECGNFNIEFPEPCDGPELDNQTCVTQGFYTGNLACLADCSDFDTSGCVGRCGDDLINGGEVCDGTDLNNQTCQTRGFYTGALACLADCSNFDTSGCSGYCGDNQTNGTEVCDGSDINSQTCADHGFYSGNLACLGNCTGYDTSNCSGFCGDGIIQSGFGETCDGTNVGGQTCQGLSLPPGNLVCLQNCSDYDTSGCGSVVVINEIALGGPDWVELVNQSGAPIDLQNWVLEHSGYDGVTPMVIPWTLPAYPLADGGRVLILDEWNGDGSPPTVDVAGGTIQFHDNIWWGSDPGAVTLYDDNNTPVDFARWGGTDFNPPAFALWADTPAVLPAFNSSVVSLSRVPDLQDTNIAGDFCVAIDTPNAVNGACIDLFQPRALLITEIDVGTSNTPDRVEVYNPGPNAIDLEAWVLYWTSSGPGQTQGGTYLPAFVLQPGNYVVLIDNTGGTPYVDAAGIHIYNINFSSTRNGACYLWDPIWTGVDFVRWGGSASPPQPPDQWADTPAPLGLVPLNLTLGRRNLTDTDVAGNWCILQTPSLGSANGACQ